MVADWEIGNLRIEGWGMGDWDVGLGCRELGRW